MTTFLRIVFTIELFLSGASVLGQPAAEEIFESNKEFREEINHDYADSIKSPLTKEDFAKFKELPFFPVDTNFCVIAKLKRSKRKKSFKMKTTTDRRPIYDVYATASFTLNGKEYTLSIYQSQSFREMKGFKEQLFLPYKGLSNGEETYGGGRFVDLNIPDGDTIVIDFNQSYNPYCAYSTRYSCPIPPKDNFLNLKVLAGVKNPH